MPVTTTKAPEKNVFDFGDDDDEEGWQDMEVVHEDTLKGGLDEEDVKKYHYVSPSSKSKTATNATGNLIDFDDAGNEWRSKAGRDEALENEYTRLRINEEDETDEVHMRTKYLFDEDKAMTPLSQMQATKNLLTEGQRIAYVGLCSLMCREMANQMKAAKRKELKHSLTNMELWSLKIMGRLYYHMELETQEQKMIESLGEHGVEPMDLVPSLMTTHTISNPEYDPAEARRKREEQEIEEREAAEAAAQDADDITDAESISGQTLVAEPIAKSQSTPKTGVFQTTARVLEDTATSAIPGVSTTLSTADEKVTLDIRWTILCDLFLVLIADSVYDARSRVLLESVALKLGLGWIDVVRFESRVTEALEIQEGVEKMESQDIIDGRMKANRRKRYMMVGLATLGGGLVIGLSAGLLAPVIGVGLGTAFGTIGVSGATTFLAGTGGAAVITTTGVLTGSGIAAKGMVKRTQQVRTFEVLPLHNNKRVSAILTVPGFLNGVLDDPRLPFSVLDPVVGDVYSVLWEPEMIRETGSALKILGGEVLTQTIQTVLQATVMATLMSALQWPIILTKLGYLIDNPWNNALDRAKAAGSVLADILLHRNLGVRPITLIGFSLGARVIFYALLELAKQKAYGIVQDVFLMGATLSVSQKAWYDTRAVVSGRYVNAYARNDWVLNYLFRATSGGVGTVAGLRPVEGVIGLENVDVTDKIAGHMSYRTFMPLILDSLGFPVFADYFDEPENPDFEGDRVVVQEEEEKETKKGWFGSKKKKTTPSTGYVSRPPSASTFSSSNTKTRSSTDTDDLPPRESSGTATPESESSASNIPKHAGFDFAAIKDAIGEAEKNPVEMKVQDANGPPVEPIHIPPPANRTVSAPILPLASGSLPSPREEDDEPTTPTLRRTASYPEQSNGVVFEGDEEEADIGYSRTPTPPPPPPPKTSAVVPPSPVIPPSPVGYQPPPTLSFGGSGGSVWDAPSSSSNASSSSMGFGGGIGYKSSTFASSPPPMDHGLSFGSSDGSISFGGSDGSISFGGPGGSVTPGMSFGGRSSSNGFGSSTTSLDSWRVPSEAGVGKKKPPNTGGGGGGFESNPWT